MSAALRLDQVSKRFGDFQAVRDLSFEAARGRMHAVELHDDVEACVSGVDAVVLVTEWPEILALDWTNKIFRIEPK